MKEQKEFEKLMGDYLKEFAGLVKQVAGGIMEELENPETVITLLQEDRQIVTQKEIS